jgi:hypothetical protein
LAIFVIGIFRHFSSFTKILRNKEITKIIKENDPKIPAVKVGDD